MKNDIDMLEEIWVYLEQAKNRMYKVSLPKAGEVCDMLGKCISKVLIIRQEAKRKKKHE